MEQKVLLFSQDCINATNRHNLARINDIGQLSHKLFYSRMLRNITLHLALDLYTTGSIVLILLAVVLYYSRCFTLLLLPCMKQETAMLLLPCMKLEETAMLFPQVF